MKFAVQTNLMNEDQLQLLRGAVEKHPHVYIGVIPFSRDITSNEPLEGTDYIPYGSTLLTNLAFDRQWKGLFFDVAKMNYRNFLENHPMMLNDNVMNAQEAITFLRTEDPDKLFFTRPSEDLKQYSGTVLNAKEIADWFESMISCPDGGTYYMPPEKDVVLCNPKPIQAEWRWFIVNGKIVSGSMYRCHGQLRNIRETDPAVIEEAQALADMWLPFDTVVMDTAITEDSNDVKVIEFNCINSSGFYDNDVVAIFDALWNRCS